jgi:O-antigen/teichoic acid export membrane protein
VLRTNILANLAGSGWIALLTLVATPIQIHLLGVEAYGLVGLITVLQIVFATLDLGLSASVTQTIASDRSEGRHESAALTNSVGAIYSIMAIAIGGLLWLTAGWIATRWLKPQSLDHQTVLIAVRAIGLYVAFRWPISFYTGVLNGVQRMDVLNLLKAGAQTVRIFAGIGIIVAWPSIALFLAWFAASALLELIAFAAVTHWLVPELRPTLRVSMAAIRSVWRFSLTMAAIAALSMLLTQMDRIFVSKLLSLQAFGYYSLAYTAGIAISLLQLSINSATLPAYAEAASHGTGELGRRYAKVSELTSFAVALPCALLVFFGGDILKVWVSTEAARGAGPPLILLAVGFFLNAAVSNAYLAAVATRNAGIPAKVNAVAAVLYAPALFALTRSFGTAGAALGWVLLNLYYLPTLVPAVHRKVLHQPVLSWVWHGLAAPVLTGVAAVGAMKASAVALGSPVATWAAFVAAMPLYGLVAYTLISPALRTALHREGGLGLVLPFGRTSAS